MTVYIGIDPGMQGAIGVYHPADVVKSKVYDLPTNAHGIDPHALAGLVREIREGISPFHTPIFTVVENVNSRPRQQGTFAFGLGTGIIHGCLASAGLPFQLVAPSRWKPGMGLGRLPDETTDDNKSRAREVAAILFPHLAREFRLKKHDGRAEALLMAVYMANRP